MVKGPLSFRVIIQNTINLNTNGVSNKSPNSFVVVSEFLTQVREVPFDLLIKINPLFRLR